MKKIQYLILPAITLALFIIWTVLVKTVDVKYIQDIGFLGFYSFNTSLNEQIKSLPTDTFHMITNILLYGSFLTVLPFAVMGIVQLIVKKSFVKVDWILYMLLFSYVITVASYFIFELVKINYSPLSTADELKPSYPSSHVLIFTVIILTNLTGLLYYVNFNKVVKVLVISFICLLVVLMVVFRLLSGHHYFTDIVGAILLSANLLSIGYTLGKYLGIKKKEEVATE